MIETYFVITVNVDGTLTSYAKVPENLPEETRPANNWDIYQAAKQIVEEFENQRIADRVAQTIIAAMNPPAAKVSDKVAEALKDRGINPESVSPAE